METLPLLKTSWARKVERSHSRVPGLRKIPLRALGIILLIAVLNAAVWIAAAIVLVGVSCAGRCGYPLGKNNS
jgi:hypothetical protein